MARTSRLRCPLPRHGIPRATRFVPPQRAGRWASSFNARFRTVEARGGFSDAQEIRKGSRDRDLALGMVIQHQDRVRATLREEPRAAWRGCAVVVEIDSVHAR